MKIRLIKLNNRNYINNEHYNPFLCSMHANDAIDSQGPATIRNVFLQVTNNHNTCHQPRLIPQYMNLDDLKFRTCGSDNIQVYKFIAIRLQIFKSVTLS